MKKILLVLITCGLLAITACASKTTYIEIQQPTKLWMNGKPIYSAEPGDILRVEKSKTCRSGKGTCWWVKNDKEGYGGIVSADEMNILHRVYTLGNTEETTSPKKIETNKNGLFYKYSNNNIGIIFQYPEGWNVHDNQEKMKNSQLSLLKKEINDSFVILVTPSNKIQHKYDFVSLKNPILTLVIVNLPKKGELLNQDLINQYVKFKMLTLKEEGALIDGPINFKMNGIKWRIFSAEIKSENGFIKSYSHVDNKGKLYEISAMCKLNEKEQYATSFNKIVRSVRFGVE